MAGLEEIDALFDPQIVDSIKFKSPVTCKIWKGGDLYETIILDSLYPFDTLDTLKQSISVLKPGDEHYLPQYLFIGIKIEDSRYTPLDYTWYPPGVQDAKRMIYLPHPAAAMESPIGEFIVRGGGKPALVLNPRGRTMIEDLFKAEIPEFIVFPFHHVVPLFKGAKPISEGDWYQRFYPYYPQLSRAPKVSREERTFAKVFTDYLTKRKVYLQKIDSLLRSGSPLATLVITGVNQIRLRIQVKSRTFDDCQTLFYETKVHKRVPYMRIVPKEGTPITKILVSGILPIPDLDNPEVIGQWAKEPTPTIGHDFLMLKYVHRPATSVYCPVYGTLRIFHDGTSDITVQSPKGVRKLEPSTDFNKFGELLTKVVKGLPLDLKHIELGEAALIFKLNGQGSPKFTTSILKKRLPFFSPFFQELAPLKDTLISLRYKVVSQYASENNIFAFLTQYTELKKLEGSGPLDMIRRLQEEFQLSEADALFNINQWRERGGTLSIVIPEENEFMESFKPGIDIHIYGQHPDYTFHVHRIDSYQTLQRVYTVLSALFSDDAEGRFTESEGAAAAFSAAAAIVEKAGIREEEGARKGAAIQTEGEATASGIGAAEEEEEEEGAMLQSMMILKPKASASAAASAAPAPTEDKKKAVVIADEKQADVNPYQWFINKLKSVDKPVFGYEPKGQGDTAARRCGATDDRLPAVLTSSQYEYMLEIYEKEISAGELFFNVYPFRSDKDQKKAGKGGINHDALEITVSRYSSDPKKDIYLFCPLLFCLRDNLMVLEEDFESDTDREGNKKTKYTCPFCKGIEIPLPRDRIIKNATVFRRKPRPTSTKPHLYIGFLGSLEKSKNPEGFALPCCFTKIQTDGIRISDPEYRDFAAVTVSSDKGRVLDLVEGETAPKEPILPATIKKNAEIVSKEKYIPYKIVFSKLHTAYIKDANKYPLGPGDAAILPEPLEDYFQQISSTFVSRTTSQQKLKTKGQGFLRIGVESGPTQSKCDSLPKYTESLFGVLAPLLSKNSSKEVRELLLTTIQGGGGPRLFVNANFGNLVNEFYVPSDPDIVPERTAETLMDKPKPGGITNVLKTWASTHLGISATERNSYAIRRIYKSYNRFVAFLQDSTQRKDLRHLSTFLTEPGLLATNPNGLQLIVLEWSEGQESVVVRCSPYGFSKERHGANDFAFVWRNADGLYELLLYTKNASASGPTGAVHDTIIRWEHVDKYSTEDPWPRIVKDRVNEYMKKCKSQYTSLFTSQMGIESKLVPLSVALTTEIPVPYKEGLTKQIIPNGVVRDSYNHAVFVVYSLKKAGPMIAMPIADDGYMPQSQQLYLDIADVAYAPAEQVIAFYEKYISGTFAAYPGYSVRDVSRKNKVVIGLQLENGVFIPAGDASKGTDLSAYPGEIGPVDQEWDMNRQLAETPCGTSPDLTDTPQKRLEELYQYFRYMVSNWIATDAGPDIRDTIEDIIYNDGLPEYEKRKRLEILCGNFTRGEDEETGWLGWMQPTKEAWDLPTGLLRKDCRVLGEADCTGACVWRTGTDGKGSCALHVDATTRLRSTTEPHTVTTRILFSRRVIDELVRFPKRRLELLEQSVSKMSTITEPIRDGDQYIIPERGMSWLSLLRLDWRPPEKETPLFYEEMTTERKDEEVEEENEESGDPLRLPAELAALVGSKPPYQLWIPEEGLPEILTALNTTLDKLGASPGDTMLGKKGLQAYVDNTDIFVGIINLTTKPPTVEFLKSTKEPAGALILVFLKDQIGLLVNKPKKSSDPPETSIAISELDGRLLEAWREKKKVAAPAVAPPAVAPDVVRRPRRLFIKRTGVALLPGAAGEEASEKAVPVAPVAEPVKPVVAQVAPAVPVAEPVPVVEPVPEPVPVAEPAKPAASAAPKKQLRLLPRGSAAVKPVQLVASAALPVAESVPIELAPASSVALPAAESVPIELAPAPSVALPAAPSVASVALPGDPSVKPPVKPPVSTKTAISTSRLRRKPASLAGPAAASLSVIPEGTVEQSQTAAAPAPAPAPASIPKVSAPAPAPAPIPTPASAPAPPPASSVPATAPVSTRAPSVRKPAPAPAIPAPAPSVPKLAPAPVPSVEPIVEPPSPTSNASAKTPELNFGSNTTSSSGNTARNINSIKKPNVI
jgi:hypothetical protein